MHPFADYIRILGRGKKGSRDLTREEARTALGMLLRGECDPLQVGAFLMLLRVKEETPQEVAGFVEAARQHCNLPARPLAVDIDWPSYAGKRRQNPWFLLAALGLAQAGYRIFIHTSSGHTPDRLYTATALQQLGLPVSRDWHEAADALQQRGLACLPLQQFCPALEQLIHLKPVLGLRSIANSLVRLLDPLQARLLASSIFHPAYGPLHQQAMQALGVANGLTFKGDGGEIEIRPDASTTLYRIREHAPLETGWPRALAQRQPDAEGALSVQAMLDLWHGQRSDSYGEAAVIHTMGVMLYALGRADAPQAAIAMAGELWQAREARALPRQALPSP